MRVRLFMSILIKNGRIITADADYIADIFIEGETISTIGKNLNVKADKEIDASGKLVFPGGIDPHVHLDMPFMGTFSSDTYETGTRAALFGGTILLAGAISDAGLQQYLHSIDHFKEVTKQAKVDVELQNHPLYDGLEERLAKLRDRKPGAPHPFIVGKSNYQKFLDVQAECMRAAVARRVP